MVWARKSRAALCPLLILVLYPSHLHSIAGALRSTPSLPPHGPVFPPLRDRPRGGNDGDGSPPGDDGSTIRRESRMAGGGLHTAPASVVDDQPTSPHPVCLPGLRDSGDHAVGSHPLNPLMAFNSLTKSKVPILPFEDGKILMYSCGPTVYAPAHLGHARTYILLDAIRRILRDWFRLDVFYVVNFTDIDDKIIARAREQGVPPLELARKWEAEFNNDMRALGVDPPDASPRVSDHIPQVCSFIQRLISKGMAYCTGRGDVYFDTCAFEAAGFRYRQLVPQSRGGMEGEEGGVERGADDEGGEEGGVERGADDEGGEGCPDEDEGKRGYGPSKKDSRDFALWKSAKEGEDEQGASWESPWGLGRPGWHIECSAMIEATLGSYKEGRISIHCGGEDLKFPHHDNEIAQSVAYHSRQEWCDVFMHTGHLGIDGCKMSKSLKNFVTVGEALSGEGGATKISAVAMRLLFLSSRYGSRMDLCDEAVDHAKGLERQITHFMASTSARLRDCLIGGGPASTKEDRERELRLMSEVSSARLAISAAFSDDFDIPSALHAVFGLISRANAHMAEGGGAQGGALQTARAQVVSTLGLVGVMLGGGGEAGGGDGALTEQGKIGELLHDVVGFRSKVREAARAGSTLDILKMCDEFRDSTLPSLGVEVRDGRAGTCQWNLADPSILASRKAEEEASKRARLEAKQKADQDRLRAKEEKERRSSIPPTKLFLHDTRFSSWDGDGFPTHTADGKELSGSQAKKLRKEVEKQAKVHAAYLDSDLGRNLVQSAPVTDATE